jgi:hypothetical protein
MQLHLKIFCLVLLQFCRVSITRVHAYSLDHEVAPLSAGDLQIRAHFSLTGWTVGRRRHLIM